MSESLLTMSSCLSLWYHLSNSWGMRMTSLWISHGHWYRVLFTQYWARLHPCLRHLAVNGSSIAYTNDVFGKDFHFDNAAAVVLFHFWLRHLVEASSSSSMYSTKLRCHVLVALELLYCRPMWKARLSKSIKNDSIAAFLRWNSMPWQPFRNSAVLW